MHNNCEMLIFKLLFTNLLLSGFGLISAVSALTVYEINQFKYLNNTCVL